MNNSIRKEQLFEGVFNASPFAIILFCLESKKIVTINNRGIALFGYSEEELINETYEKLSLKENNSYLLEINFDNSPIETRLFNKLKFALDVEITNSIVILEKRQFIMSTIVNVEKHLEVKDELIQSEQHYKLLFNNSINGIALFDMDERRYVSCNKMFSEIYGYSEAELNDLSVIDLVWKDKIKDTTFYEQRYTENYNFLSENQIIRFESVHKTKKGEKIYVNIVLIPYRIKGKLYAKQVTTDITLQYLSHQKIDEIFKELRSVNEELNESNYLLESYAYVISHDLREPVRTIVGLSQLIRKSLEQKNKSNTEEFTELIEKAGRDLNTMIDDILAFSKVKKSEVQFQKTDVSIIIEKVLLHLRSIIVDRNIDIQVSSNIPNDIIAHNTYLYQVFQNLIKNAIKFSKKDETCVIKINYKDCQDFHQFSIKDNGIGIEKKFFKAIFKLFNKLHSKREYEGTGIGLSICEKIVQFHEGNMWLESELGVGTTFYFTIKKNLEIPMLDKS